MAPRASRPTLGMRGGEEQLPWSWAEERLTNERNYWVVTRRESGFPQARPVWGVWMNGVLGLTVGHGGIQRAAQRADGRFDATVHLESALDVVILEGAIERVAGGSRADRLDVADPMEFDREKAFELYNAKYPDFPGDMVNFAMRPQVAYGWKGGDLRWATKWTFDVTG